MKNQNKRKGYPSKDNKTVTHSSNKNVKPGGPFVKPCDDQQGKYGHPRQEIEFGANPNGSKNSYDFYIVDEQMGKDIGNLPFSHVTGVPFKMYDGTGLIQNEDQFNDNLPAMMVVDYLPVCGTSMDATSGINLAARQLYSYIRMKNSGAKNYEAPDLMMYLLAMEQVYVLYLEARRAYAAAHTFYYMNRNMPNAVCYGLGVDAVDLRANAAQYRGKLNVLREQINSLPVPRGFKSFERRAVVASQVFSDSTSLRGGMYAFKATGFYEFDATKYSTGGSLSFVSFGGVKSLQNYINAIARCVSAIINDTDMATMGGDIVKAFGEGGLYAVPEVSEDLKCVPVYDEDILGQIENSMSVHIDKTATLSIPDYTTIPFNNLDVFQAGGTLLFRPKLVASNTSQSLDAVDNFWAIKSLPIINSHKDIPDYKDVIEWSRCIPTADDVTQETIWCGLELVTDYELILPKDKPGVTGTPAAAMYISSYINITGYDSYQVSGTLWLLSAINQFDWHPRFQVYSTHTDGKLLYGMTYNLDLKVYTHIDRKVLRNLHDMANYSVYYIKGLY